MSGRGKGPGRVARQIRLAFQHHSMLESIDDPIREDLSACARIGDSLFVSCDETSSVERLVPEGKAVVVAMGR